MRGLKLFVLGLAFGAAACGCKNEGPAPAEEKDAVEKQEGGKELAMGLTLKWLGHASFRISDANTVIYIDPWKLKDSPHDANIVLVSHSHQDHYSPDDIAKVSGTQTKLVGSTDVIAQERVGQAIVPGMTLVLEGVRVKGVAAYNPSKQFHPKAKQWVGFVIEVGSKRIYYAGDTDVTDEMKALKDIDVALLPVGGKYTMNAEEAAGATGDIKPKLAVPYHYGDIVGSETDAEKFKQDAACEVKVLKPGESLSVK